jgi:cysteine-rich repeat protein
VAVSVAPPEERIFVAWMADEALDSNQLTLRTAVRPSNALTWDYSNHPDPFTVNRLSAGYDPDSEVFVVTTLTAVTTEVQVVLFDIDGVPLGPAIVLEGLQVFGVGTPLCEGGRCLVPFSEPEFGGPDFGIAEVMVDALTLNTTLLSTEILKPVSTYGGLSLVRDGDGLLGGTGERRFFLGSYPGLTPDGTELLHNPDGDWALGVGLWGPPDSTTRRLFQPRPVVCGNGIVQASEQCDDANTVPGDGCDACSVTNSGTESDSDSESGDTGGGFDSVEDSCECRTDGSGGSWLGFISMFGIVTVTVRSRRSASGE